MLSINVNDCKECEGIRNLLEEVDEKLYHIAGDEYHYLAYLVKKRHTSEDVKQLIRYKNILTNLFWNSGYYSIDFKTITSKIKSIL